MKIAYIISAYKYPEQLIRLVDRLNAEATSFFVHVDKKSDDRIYQQMVDGLSSFPNVYFLKRHRCYWGDFGHVNATLKGIQEIFKRDIAFDWLILLTGQDYPIKSNSQIERFLHENQGKSFMEYFPLPRSDSSKGLPKWPNGGFDRLNYWHFCLFDTRFVFPGKRKLNTYYAHFVQPTINVRIISALWFSFVFWVPIKRKFPQGFKPFGGSSYWCLSKECVEYIYNFIQQNPRFVSFFKYVDIPDEMFFQTIILNSPFKESVINDTLKYEDWENPTPNLPSILFKNDFGKLQNSSKLFARKFDITRNADILDMIDQKILNIDNSASMGKH